MLKELHELKGCLCEQTEDTRVVLVNEEYTAIGARKDKYGLVLFAWGDGDVEYKPDYCPFCGRRLKRYLQNGGQFSDMPTMQSAT